ncbi:uncharacterized protein LOC120635838 [Pararge aegeria]|uniref:Jg15856 protein n=2 Tax=Pararge aegeria TaxID=116150 RepID=A0A8S4RC00_9NEOP|nr:uncharacterized protein LOC120635838 [Pararge aegeria]CAH2232330.1 jg15856 [Pararge aegeria aegeria]
MTQINIEKVYPKESIYPMIFNFQNGYVTDQFTTQECMIFDNSTNHIKTVATVIDKLVYAGEEKTEELSKTFILARNKKTGKVRLIESCVTDMKPVLNIKNANNDVSTLLDTSNLELSRKFGSKKHKQQMEHLEKLKVNVETVTEQMQNVTQEVSKDDLDLTTYDKNNSDDFYIPPIDRAASSAEEVYNIDSILTQEQYDKILSELEGKDYLSDMPQLIKNLVTKNKLSSKLLVLAVYSSSLIQMYSTVMKKIATKNFVVCPHSVTLNEIVLRDFCSTSNGRRTRPAPYKDKTLCHAIVFLLLINNLKIELEALCEELKLTPNTASIKVRVTGASIITSGSKKVVQLKLPLNTKSSFSRRKSTKF